MTIYTPYTYLIGWSKYQLYYYGVRIAKNCSPSDLWTKYFTSSKYVSEYRKLYGEPDIIQIRRTFLTREDAILWEAKVLKKIIKDPRIINKNVAGAILNDEAVCTKISAALKGKSKPPRSKEHKENLSKAGMGHTVSDKTRNKLKLAATGVERSNETKKKMSESQKGKKRPHTAESKRKISEGRKRRVLVDSVSKFN